MLGLLMSLLVAEKSGFAVSDNPEAASLKEFADRVSKQAMESMEAAMSATNVDVPPGNGKSAAPARLTR
jgi:hypothetical protein